MRGEFTKEDIKKEIELKLKDLENINNRISQVVKEQKFSEARELNKRMLNLLQQIMIDELGMKH
jgi:ribosome-binding ATPase YchF (GTP1/OBG family)